MKRAPADPVTDPAALTPIWHVSKGYYLKRDDLFEVAGVRGAKARFVWAASEGVAGLVTAGSRSSPQVNVVAQIARARGVPCRAHVPSGKLDPELELAAAAGAELVQHRAGRNSVLTARSRDDAVARGWTLIPLGLDLEEAVASTERQVRRIPKGVQRIIVCVGYGITLAGILRGLEKLGRDLPVVGLRVGADPSRRLDRYVPGWRKRVKLTESIEPYDAPAAQTERWGIAFDPHYEAKVLPFLKPGDLLWVAGLRQSVQGVQPVQGVPKGEKTRRAPRSYPPGSTQILRSPDGRAEVRLEDARGLEAEPESARLIVGASVYLGKKASWDDYMALYRDVYVERCLPALRPDGYFVLITTDAYARGEVIPRSARTVDLLMQAGLELIDRKIWKRLRADHFQPPFSEVSILRRSGGSAKRTGPAKHPEYFRGVWDYPQSAGGGLNAYPPALCRLLIEALTEEGDLVLDPFAGTACLLGVAASLGRRGLGYEIDADLAETIERNLAQAEESEPGEEGDPEILTLPSEPTAPSWIHGDAADLDALVPEGLYDLVFTCPPYYDLEQYTDDPADLSNATTYEAFLDAYRAILERAFRRLRRDRFAVIVVGEIRDPEGRCRTFVAETIRIAHELGLQLYNEAVLITPHGSLPIRVARQFETSRKLGRTHQTVLVFLKGDWRKAAEALGRAEFGRGEDLNPDELTTPEI